ncbi:MAG TPA: hypothetical protein VE981_13745 [Planctomycetota bacterium]|nr:hypothetical protein [Planctomycetota bacterium]
MRLEDITFKTPCTVSWEVMKGGGSQVRHCPTCDRDVYNLSAMTREEAQAFLDSTFGRFSCVQLWKRDDGIVVTSDCGPTPPSPRPMLRSAGAPVMPPH